jgi:hypothetical protein
MEVYAAVICRTVKKICKTVNELCIELKLHSAKERVVRTRKILLAAVSYRREAIVKFRGLDQCSCTLEILSE